LIAYIKKITQKLKAGQLKQIIREAVWIKDKFLKNKLPVMLFVITGLVGTVMSLAASVVSKYLIDAVTGFKTAQVGFYTILIVIAAVISIVIKAASSRYFARVSIKIHNELQAEIFQKILNADWESVSIFHSGDLLNRLSSDVGTISSGILNWFPSLVIQLVTLIASLAILLYYDPAMTLIAAGCAPISLLLSRLIMNRLSSYNSQMRQAGSEIISFQEETIQNLQLIKSFNLTKVFAGRMREIQKQYLDLSIEFNKFSVYAASFLSIIGMITSYAAFGWGIYRLWTGAITYGTMTMFLQLAGTLSGAFSALTGLIPGAVDLLTCAGRLIDICDLKDENDQMAMHKCENLIKPSASDLLLELSNLDFAYKNGEKVLKKANMLAKSGDLIAVVGPSGEGKSTLFKILLGLLKPSGGQARLYDQNGGSRNISAATREYFSYVPQGNMLMSGSIADNLRLAKKDATDEELIQALETACAYSFIRELPEGIYTRIGERGLGLSEGQAQRIAIARALLRNAPILLLDEATSALDAETEAKVLKGIMEYGKSRICIFATHRNKILAECKSIYRINNMKLTKVTDSRDLNLQYDNWNENIKLA